MTINSPQGGLPTPTEDARIQVSRIDTTDWLEIPGVSRINVDPDDAATRPNKTFQKITQHTGNPGPGSITVECGGLTIAHDSYDLLADAFEDKDYLKFRWQYVDRLIWKGQTGAMVAIAADGSVTFSGSGTVTHPKWGVGRVLLGAVLRTGTSPNYVYHKIKSYDADTGEPTATARTTALTASAYDVVAPPIYQPEFHARVTRWTGVQGEVDSELSATLMLAPEVIIPRYQLGYIIT